MRAGVNCHVRRGGMVNPCGKNLHFRGSMGLNVLGFLTFRRAFGGSLAALPVNNTGNNSSFSPHNGDGGRIVHFYRTFVARLCHRVNPSRSIPTNSVNMNNHRMNCLFNVCGGLARRFRNILANGNRRFNNSLVHPRTANCNGICFLYGVLTAGNVSVGNGAMLISNSNGITRCAVRGLLRLNTGPIAYSSSSNCVCSPSNVSHRGLSCVVRLGGMRHNHVGRCTRGCNMGCITNTGP